MKENDIQDLDELRLSNLPIYLEKLNQNIINLHKEVIKKDLLAKNKNDIHSKTPIRQSENKLNDKESIKYEKKNKINYNENKERNSFYTDNKKQNKSKDTKLSENKSFIESNDNKYKKVFVQKFTAPTTRQNNNQIKMKKIKNIVLGKDKKNFDISEVNICKRKSINNMIKNELENRSLSKSPNKFSFKPRKRKNDFSFDKNEEKNINYGNNDNKNIRICTSPTNKSKENQKKEEIIDEIKKNNKNKILVFPKKIIYQKRVNSFDNNISHKKNINDNKKNLLIFDLLNMILLYNEYIISELKLNNDEKIIMTQYSSFLIDKILILDENKNNDNNNENIINIDLKEKSAKIIQRKWRNNLIKKNIQNKGNTNINYELRKMVVNDFIEKKKNKIKNIIHELNNILNSYSILNIKKHFFKEIIKLIKGINDQEKYYYYKDYINKIIFIENLF